MPDPKSRPDEPLNPYAPPHADPYQELAPRSEASLGNHRSRVRVLRMLAMMHIFFSLLSTAAVITSIARVARDWNEPIRYQDGPLLHPEPSARRRNDAVFALGVATFALMFGGLSLAVGVALWRLRRRAGKLAMVQVFFLLALGLSTGTYQLFTSVDPSGFAWMVAGIVLYPLAEFTRSRRSVVVCSDAHWNCRTEVAHASP